MSFVKIKSWLTAMVTVATVALAGCGGGGSSGTPFVGGTDPGTSTASKVDVTSTNATLGDGSSAVTITAVVKDANNVAMASTPVKWSTTAGSLTGAATTTDANGTAVASFSASDRSAGTAKITVTSGSASGNTTVALQGARAVDMTATAASVGTDGSSTTITAVIKDASGVAISGATVVWQTTAGSLSSQQSVTNASGVATAVFTASGVDPTKVSSATVTASTYAGSSSTNSTVYSGTLAIGIAPTTTSIELIASQSSIGTGGEQVTISAFVKDGNNLAKVGAPVSWSVDKGRISNQVTTTNANGIATALLDAGSDKSNRTAVVTVTSGSTARQTLNVPIVNTKLAVSGATTLNVGSAMDLTFTATDSKGVVIPGITLGLTSSLGNGLTTTATTNASGQAIVTYTATKAGADTVTVSGAGATVSTAITVSGSDEDLAFITPAASTKVVVGQSQTLTVRYRKAGVAQANAAINLAATIGVLSASSVVTDATGQASVTIVSGFAGSASISATLGGSTAVQGTLPLSFVAKTPATLVLQLTPTALAPNASGSSTNQSTLVAKVTDANNNPVADTTVNFSQVADPSGGRLQQASAVTDLNGVATVQYVSGAESTASGAVQLKASVASNPTVSGTASMTVNGSALFIALGTGNSISNYDPQTYEKNWTVYVTDANGVRVTNVPVTLKVIPAYYGKGQLEWSDTKSLWVNVAGSPLMCANEDVNLNGRLDSGEDTNGDGVLTPGNLVALLSSTVTTDANGVATITMRYAESVASWLSVRLTATAVVAGTESTTYKEFPLDVLGSDYSVKTIAPAGRYSPFGIDTTTCSNPN